VLRKGRINDRQGCSLWYIFLSVNVEINQITSR